MMFNTLLLFLSFGLHSSTGSIRIPDVIYIRRSRKAGSGTIVKFLEDELNRRVGHRIQPDKRQKSVFVYSSNNDVISSTKTNNGKIKLIDTGTMNPFDSCCLIESEGCPSVKHSPPPYSNSSVFTITHLREPISWRQAEFWYAGLGSDLVKPAINSAESATEKNSTAMWAAWMAEGDPKWKPQACGSLPPVVGYPGKLHTGFGFYQSNFLVRNLLGECGCVSPYAEGLGNCGRVGTTKLPEKGRAPDLSRADFERAQQVLASFDLVIPVERYSHPVVPYYILWRMGFSYTCPSFVYGQQIPRTQLGHLHDHKQEDARKAAQTAQKTHQPPMQVPPRSPAPPCVEAALREQNSLESQLYEWSLARFDAELAEFEKLGPQVTCVPV